MYNNKIEILEDYKHGDLINPNTNFPLELDYFLPELQLAFEYQGSQHYKESSLFGSLQERQNRDLIKSDLCKKVFFNLNLFIT